jgi:hypothetical protein
MGWSTTQRETMIRNLKMLGLALVAVLAMAAMTASAASASPTFTTTNGATITGEEVGNVKFTVTGREVICGDVAYIGTAPAASFSSITVTPSYAECGFGPLSATIDGFGAGECDFVLRSTGTSDLVCAAGKEVTVTAASCITHIPPQNNLKTITYDTGTAPSGKKDLTLTINITKIKETHTDGFLCPLEGSGTTETAVLEGTVTATASVFGNPVDLTDH